MSIFIESKRLLIREILPGDIDCLLEIYRDDQNMKFIPNSNFNWTRERLKDKYQKINQDYKNGFGIFAVQIKDNGKIIGEAGLFNSFQDSTHLELGYILNKRFWRKGYGSEIAISLIDYGFITLNLDKITARMFKQNLASIRLSEKCGMKLIQQDHAQKVKEYFEYEIYNSNKLK
jgi:ribosomal-protein-alanine N-acetyltransferase